MKYLPHAFIFGLLAFFVAIASGFRMSPELAGLLCVVVPCAITGAIGYTVGKRGRPRIRLEFGDEDKS